MRISGTHTFPASAEQLFTLLMDADVLARITPGISELEKIDDDKYKAIANVKMGPVSGSFKGELDVIDKVPPNSFALLVSQKSRIGNVSAEVKIHLDETTPGQTELRFDGQAKLSGLLARTGQRVLSGVSNTLSKQFFAALEKELHE